MRRLVLIGIGAGNPEHMTVQGIGALNSVDAIFVPRKGEEKDGLAELRREICRRYLTNPQCRLVEFDLPARDTSDPSYRHGVDAWHDAVAAGYGRLLAEQTEDGASVALLVWGDPALYDSTLRIVERLRDAGLAIECAVIPGIASPQALAARHAIPLNTIGGAVHVTTGRRLRASGFPDGADSAVVMLDGDCAFLDLQGEAFDIYWGAFLGMEGEIAVSGRLSEVGEEIKALRDAARQRHGWIMDIYLLRRR
jgi:precorrin-6A synthase